MEKVNIDMTLRDIVELPELAEYSNYIKYNGYVPDSAPREADPEFDVPLSERGLIGAMTMKGMNFLLDCVDKGRSSLHRVYADADCIDEPEKRDVNIVRLVPERPDPDKPYVILCSGGAYICVCHHVEAYPTAEHFVEAGYQVFVMTYRVRMPAVMPKALSDVAAAIRYIKKHEDEFGLDGDNYAIGGYSAGGNLISTWGTTNVGYKAFDLPKPKAMFPIYAAVDFSGSEIPERHSFFMVNMLGHSITDELIARYNVLNHIDKDYPPCYIVCGKDDDVVPCENSERMKERLDCFGVPATLEEAAHAQHGFGDGTGFEVEGWPERAIAFLKQNTAL